MVLRRLWGSGRDIKIWTIHIECCSIWWVSILFNSQTSLQCSVVVPARREGEHDTHWEQFCLRARAAHCGTICGSTYLNLLRLKETPSQTERLSVSRSGALDLVKYRAALHILVTEDDTGWPGKHLANTHSIRAGYIFPRNCLLCLLHMIQQESGDFSTTYIIQC